MTTIDAHGNLHRGVGDGGGQFEAKQHSAPAGLQAAVDDLTTQEPPQIDDVLADLYYGEQRYLAEAAQQAAAAEKYRERLAKLSDIDRRRHEQRYVEMAGRAETAAEKAREAAKELEVEMRPLEAEFRRRGGWSRAFLVSGGHLHRSMACTTCYPTTQYAWMTAYSGADEDEIVAAVGERACTVCYPSAPVEVLARPSTMLTPDETAAAEARRVREEERVARQAAKEAKSITAPDGSALLRHGWLRVNTLVTAERELAEAIMDVEFVATPENRDFDYYRDQREWRDALVAAIAHKRGMTAEEVVATYTEKARAKYRRDYGRSPA